jgi:phosphotriesterase-related protein
MIRKIFISAICLGISLSQCTTNHGGMIMTVNGPVASRDMGTTLTHEHILVDFIGADSITSRRWDRSKVEEVALPYLRKIKDLSCRTFIECTPAFLGRDPFLLKSISDYTGLNILTNTGFYGAGDNKYLPEFAFSETADQLTSRWIKEWKYGIDSSGIRPGFIKIGVAGGSLSEMHKKLVIAAARTHLRTGLTIVSHTGPSVPAFEQLETLKSEGVAPSAFIWVHAQAEKDISMHVKAAKMGAWISLDGINDNNLEDYVRMIQNMKDNNMLDKVLLSHDAGWYHPGEKNGGEYRGYTTLFEKLIPLLIKDSFTLVDIHKLLVSNPAEAFTIRVRSIN